MSEQEFNKIFSQNLTYYLEQYNKSQADLAKYINVSTASVSNWCKGIKLPRMDKVDKICNFLQINRSDLMEERSTEEQDSRPSYYDNPDAREMAQFMFENPEYKVLFDASRKVKKEDMVEIDGDLYDVTKDPQPDGTGMGIVILSKYGKM